MGKSSDSQSEASCAISFSLKTDDLVGDRYRVIAAIGSGGMGEVYKVFDIKSEKYYALKMISPHLNDQKTLAKRLEHEARAAKTLSHGNIVSVYDVGSSVDGAPYLIMDYVDGESLAQSLKREVLLTSDRAIAIFIQIAEALVHAQQKNIVHRDLKPSNILMTKTDNGEDMVKIVDFGIAKISEPVNTDKTKLTQTGDLLGTPLYMSPEQCIGEELDIRSDIYAFGCIMHEMLSGKPLFAAENPVKVILKHLNEAPSALPANAGIPNDLKTVISRCLEKHRSDRYATAVELQIDLERVRDGRPIKAHRSKSKQRGRLKIAAALVAATVIGAASYLGIANQPDSTKQDNPLPSAAAPPRPDMFEGKTLSGWTAAIEQSPNDPVLYLDRGYLHGMRDERTNAIDDYSKAISLKSDYLTAYNRRASMYTMTAQYDKAAADANKLIALDPSSAGSYEARAGLYSVTEQYPLAISDLKHAIALDEHGYYYYILANSLLKLATYDEAQAAINHAIKLDDGPVSSYNGVAGIIATFRQDYELAKRQLSAATESPYSRGVEWQESAYYYLCTGDANNAQKAIERAKAIETFPARASRLAGEYYRTAGQLEKAAQEFSVSTSLEAYPPGYRERAVTYMSMKQWRAAYDDLQKSIKLNPLSPVTLSTIAVVENHLGLNELAQAHLKKAFKEKAVPPIVLVNRAAVELANHDNQPAMLDVNEAISIDPWLKEAYLTRAEIYRASGQSAKAVADDDKAKTLISHLDL